MADGHGSGLDSHSLDLLYMFVVRDCRFRMNLALISFMSAKIFFSQPALILISPGSKEIKSLTSDIRFHRRAYHATC